MSVSQCDRVLAVLTDVAPAAVTVPEIHRRAGTMRLNSRISELRQRGHTIECVRLPGHTGAAAYAYRLLDPISASAADPPAVEVEAAPPPDVPERGRRPNPGDSGDVCVSCGHPDYDHVGWDCLRIGCECGGYSDAGPKAGDE